MNTAEFIEKAKKVHGDKYDYLLVNYINNRTKIRIICPIHKEFNQAPTKHLQGQGCPNCSPMAKKYRTFVQFVVEAKKVHGDKYEYPTQEFEKYDTKIKIICPDHGEFWQRMNIHLKGHGCTKCSKPKKTFLQVVEDFKKVHGNRYQYPEQEYLGSSKNIKIICPEHGEFYQISDIHLRGANCPECVGVKKLTNETFIKKAKEIYGNKYDYSKTIYINTKTEIIITCPIHGDFSQTPNSHLRGSGCKYCSNHNNTTEDFIKKADLIWRGIYDYSKVIYINAKRKVIIGCKIHGDFEMAPSNHMEGQGCPKCSSRFVDKGKFIIKAELIHKNRYDYSKVIYINGYTKVLIGCKIHGYFLQTPGSHLIGHGCPICNRGWCDSHKLSFLNSLESSDLLTMDPIELSIIIGQGNLPFDFSSLIHTEANSNERITTLQELRERFSKETEEVSQEQTELITGDLNEPNEETTIDDVDSEITEIGINEPTLPKINSTSDFHSLDNPLYATMDEEAIESLVQYKIRKLWNIVLNDESYVDTIRPEIGGKYFTEIKELLLEEYEQVSTYMPPAGYIFPYSPNLMQKLTVNRLLKNKSYGNWSGTGAGKTLSFIISSREIDAKLTLVVALNSTIKQTYKTIKSTYPDSLVFTNYQSDFVFDRAKNNYLILNYEKFQQEYSEELCQSLTNNNQIDFVVIDEVHNAKQRDESNESLRREVLNRLLGRIREKNEGLYTLVMSATPVINNLYEAKSLLNLMTGLEYDDLETRRTLSNALNIFRQLLLNGLRFIPKYDINVNELTGKNTPNLSATANHLLDDLLKITPERYADVEGLLLDEKLKLSKDYIRKGTIIYTYYTTGIVDKIKDFVQSLGFTTGTYTGEESPFFREQSLKDFVDGKIDVLIGSKPIGTGVDGLQDVCDRMILITLPWTDAEYIQLKGRIYRQGSTFDNVEFIIPQVKIKFEKDDIWSWDIQRLNLIKHKKTLADAAVDGVVPSRIMPSQQTMFKKSQESLRKWKGRIEQGYIIETNRKSSNIDLYPEVSNENERQRRINSELSEFNRRGKTTHSVTMHKEFSDNPDSWFRYHALRNERMKDWNEIPYEYIATKIKNRNHIVADFGCGENKMKSCIPNNKVYSFDHVACDDFVVACDIKDVGKYLDNESIDVAVFSLSLWGTNYKDYVKEAYRVLSYGGQIHIAEPSKSYDSNELEEEFSNLISEVGFKIVGKIERRDKFIYITGIKI